jgi:hypothetical protein
MCCFIHPGGGTSARTNSELTEVVADSSRPHTSVPKPLLPALLRCLATDNFYLFPEAKHPGYL